MKNLFSGFIISALVHTGLLSGAIYLNKKEIKEKPLERKVTLMVGIFKEEIEPTVKIPVQEGLLSAPISPSLPVIKNIDKIDTQVAEKLPKIEYDSQKIQPTNIVTNKKVIPSSKLASFSPKLLGAYIESRSVLLPVMVKQKPVKKAKIKIKKKLIKKQLRKNIKKKIVLKKVIKPKLKKKKSKPSIHKSIVKKKLLIKPKKVLVRRGEPQLHRIVSKPLKSVGEQPIIKDVKQNFRENTHSTARKESIRSSIGITNLNRQYKSHLQKIISGYSQKNYPKRAKRRGQQGKITVAFTVIYSGMIQNIRIIKSSNSRTLDMAAVQAIKRSSGKLPYYKGMSKNTLKLDITLTYVLR